MMAGLVAVILPGGPPPNPPAVDASNAALRREARRIAATKIGEVRGVPAPDIDRCQNDGSTPLGGPQMVVTWDRPSSRAKSALQTVESGLVELGYRKDKTSGDTTVDDVPNAQTLTAEYSRRVGGATMRAYVRQYLPVAPGSINRHVYGWYVPFRVDLTLDISPDGC